MEKSLLTKSQREFLEFAGQEPALFEHFYFSGGTALSEFYLQHRFSEDLDFFSEEEIEVKELNLFLQTNKKRYGNPQLQFQQSFNRNLFFLKFADGQTLKVEFTYYPFPRLENGKKWGKIEVDSVLDIAVNKVFTLTQQARGRDYFDLYIINQKYGFDFEDLVKKARQKFDYPINYLQLGKNLTKVGEFLDDPILIKTINKQQVESYFLTLTQKIAALM
jgi:predicted nucleotidyltransferase component of viral defense system